MHVLKDCFEHFMCFCLICLSICFLPHTFEIKFDIWLVHEPYFVIYDEPRLFYIHMQDIKTTDLIQMYIIDMIQYTGQKKACRLHVPEYRPISIV